MKTRLRMWLLPKECDCGNPLKLTFLNSRITKVRLLAVLQNTLVGYTLHKQMILCVLFTKPNRQFATKYWFIYRENRKSSACSL